jgi:hypothetical protein
MKQTKIIFALGGLLMTTILASCISLKPVLVTSVENFRTANVLSKPELLFDVTVQNPNKYGVRVKQMGINLFVGERNMIGLNMMNPIKIQRISTISIPIVLHPSVNDITSLLGSEFSNFIGGKSNQKLEVRGEIVMKKFIFTRKIQLRESIKL